MVCSYIFFIIIATLVLCTYIEWHMPIKTSLNQILLHGIQYSKYWPPLTSSNNFGTMLLLSWQHCTIWPYSWGNIIIRSHINCVGQCGPIGVTVHIVQYSPIHGAISLYEVILSLDNKVVPVLGQYWFNDCWYTGAISRKNKKQL